MTWMPLKDGSWLGTVPMTVASPTMDQNHFDQGYRVVAVDWKPQDVTRYVDGSPYDHLVPVARIPHSNRYAPLDTAVEGYCAGEPDPSTHLHITARLDGSGCGTIRDQDSAYPRSRAVITLTHCHTPRRRLHLPAAYLPIFHALHALHPHAPFAISPRVT